MFEHPSDDVSDRGCVGHGSPSVSVVVPVHNGGASFRRCLASLFSTSPPPLEIIVVVNGDSDGSSFIAETYGAQMIRLPEAVGPAKARNLGACQARGDILFFVDADVTIPENAVARVVSRFAQDPELTAMIGSYDDAPGAPNFLSQYKNLIHHYVHQISSTTACTFWGACGAVRREAFVAIGGFDERYRRPSIEDIELGYRLSAAGMRISLDKELQVKHLKHWRWRSLLVADVLYRALPWSQLILRDRRLLNDLNTRFDQRVSVILAFAAVIAAALQHYAASLLFLGVVLILNAPVYSFFKQKRGLWFAVRSMPLHVLYFLYSGLTFGLAAFLHIVKKPTHPR
jgi:glycosyltransferase involved in cell wall biosynthesis